MISSLSWQKLFRQHRWLRILIPVIVITIIAVLLGTILFTRLYPSFAAPTKPGPIKPVATTGAFSTKPAITVTPRVIPTHRPTGLGSVYMIDNQVGWITCADGSILRTSDGGQHWSDVSPASLLTVKFRHSIVAQQFLDSSTAWIVVSTSLDKGNIKEVVLTFRTIDAGVSWTSATIMPNISNRGSLDDYKISAVSAQEAWYMHTIMHDSGSRPYETRLYHTSNGGKTWSENNALPAISQYSYATMPAISFANAKTGVIIGNVASSQTRSTFTLVHTQDGGANWRVVNIPVPDPTRGDVRNVSSPQFLTPKDATFVTTFEKSSMSNVLLTTFHSYDAGQSWVQTKPLEIGLGSNVMSTHFFNHQQGYVIAMTGARGPVHMYTTTDGGQHWQKRSMNVPVPEEFRGVQSSNHFQNDPDFHSLTTGWVISAASAIYTTTDGCLNWKRIKAYFPGFVVRPTS